MSGDGEDNDLTRLEDLSEFLHEDDPEVDGQLETGPPEVPTSLDDEGISEMPAPPSDDDEFGSDDAFSQIESEEDASAEVSSDFFDEATNPDIEVQLADDDNYETDSFDSGDFNQELETADMSDLTSDGFDAPAEDSFGDNNDETSFGDDSDSDFSAPQPDAPEREEEDTDTQADFGSDDSFGSDSETEAFEGFDSAPEREDDAQTDAQVVEEMLADSPAPDTIPDIDTADEVGTETPETTPVPPANENFNDIKDFGNSISYGVVSHGGNPPFSLILRDIKFNDDVDDIIIILKEHGLCPDEEEDNLRKMMESGSLLISQISEYSAIFLAHKMRRFDCNILVGLSDQLHPSKSYENESRGLVSKYNLKQNVSEEITLKEKSIDIDSIFAVTTPTVSGHQIIKYLDLLTAHTVVEESDLRSMKNSSKSLDEQSEEEFLDALLEQTSTDSDEKYQFDINDTYKELIAELQSQAYKIEANAIVGINFQLSPLVHQEADDTNTILYKITATGNGVIVDEV